MATVTTTIATLPWDEAAVATVELDYNDATMMATAVRVINPSPRALIIDVSRTDHSRTHSRSFPTGTTEMAIPANVNNRLQLSLDAQGRIDGADWSIRWAEV